jgi:hypothetical protein
VHRVVREKGDVITTTPFVPDTEGVWLDLPAETYHAAPGLSHSMMKHMSPPARLPVYLKEKREPSPEMILGTLVHQRILEPNKDLPQLAIKPEGMTFASNEGKTWKRTAEANKKLIIKAEDYETLAGCIESILNHSLCHKIFQEGQSEVSLFKNFSLGGTVLRKCRLDFAPVGNSLVDIKTIRDGGANSEEFAKALYDSRYYTQASHYLDVWNDSMEEKKEHFVFIVVEKKPPYLVALYAVTPKTIGLGRQRNTNDMTSYIACVANNKWPGFAEKPQRIDLPKWRMKNERGGAFSE